MYQIYELEDVLVSALENASLKARSFNGEPDEEEFSREVITSPLVLVVFNRSERAGIMSASLKGTEFYFHLYVAARNLRSSSSAARGDFGTAGIYEVLETVRQTLSGSTLGLNIQPTQWVSEKPHIRSRRLSVYIQEWKLEAFE